jgi:hypothetical protein
MIGHCRKIFSADEGYVVSVCSGFVASVEKESANCNREVASVVSDLLRKSKTDWWQHTEIEAKTMLRRVVSNGWFSSFMAHWVQCGQSRLQ